MWGVLSGILLGLVSSFHCVGMCGPIALALPVYGLPRVQQVMAITLYHTGRLITYALAGALFGLAGQGIYIAGFQQGLAITMGVTMLLPLTLHFIMRRKSSASWLQPLQNKLLPVMGRLLQSSGTWHFLLLGMLNGVLPCGMVYMAIAGAVTTSSAVHGVLFMAAFGAGTLPAMMALSLFGLRVKSAHRDQIKRLVPYVVTGMAILFILRGLNLGIPFISPVLPGARGTVVSCH